MSRRTVPLLFMALLLACRREPASYDFTAHIHDAVVTGETVRIDFGTAADRRRLLDGWSSDETWQSPTTTVVWGTGAASTLLIDRFSRSDVEVRYRCIPIWFDRRTQAVSFIVNGHRMQPSPLEPGFHTYRQTIPGRLFRSGANELRIEYAFSAAPQAAERRSLAVAWDWLELGSTPAQGPPRHVGDSLSLPARTKVSFLASVRDGCSLRVDDVQAASDATVEALIDSASAPEPERRSLRTGTAVEIPLRSARTSLQEISFVTTKAGSSSDWTKLTRPRIVCTQPALQAQAVSSQTFAPKPNVLIYLVDTLRADHLGVYGYERATSPNIDAFARDSVVFTHAFAHSGWTKTSVTSVLSGQVPFHHGVLDRDDALPPSVVTLPAMLRSGGYSTFAGIANANVSAEFGFDRGFDRYVFLGGVDEFDGADARPVIGSFRTWLDTRSQATPFFAYVHTIEPHDPYAAPQPYGSRWSGDIRTNLVTPLESAIDTALKARPDLQPADIRRDFIAKYDGEIAYADAMFGELIADLKRRDLYDSTLIIFTADHGEEFLDHGHWGHGHTLFYELLHVPLIVKFPRHRHAGTTMSANVQHVDLAPTILDAAGIRNAWKLDGTSLMKVAALPERPIVSYLRLDAYDIMSAIYGSHHYVVDNSVAGAAQEQLYQLDPVEQAERIDGTGGEAWRRELRRTLAARYRDAQRIRAPQVPIHPELEKRLRALGYLR